MPLLRGIGFLNYFFLWVYFSLGKLGKFFINHYLSISYVCKTFPIFRKNFRKALGKF